MYVFKSNNSFIPVLSLLIAVLLWSSSFVALKFSFQTLDPFIVIFFRMAIASLCFILFACWRIQKIVFQRGDIKFILLMTLFEPCLYFIFEAKAVTLTTASQAGVITSLMPMLVAIGAYFFLKEKITKIALSGFAMAVIGACWLSLSNESSDYAPNPILGNFLEFLAMICAAGYTITLKKLTARYSAFLLTGLQAFSGCIFFLFIILVTNTPFPTDFDIPAAIVVFYLGSFVTLGAYGLYNYGVSKTSAAKASAYINLIPIFSILLGWLLLDESLSFSQSIAALIIITGILLSQEFIPNLKTLQFFRV